MSDNLQGSVFICRKPGGGMKMAITGWLALTLMAVQGAEVMSGAYRAMWNAPEVKDRIERGIHENRMAAAVLSLPSIKAGTEVKIEQLDHEFLFGANIFNFDQLGSDELNRKYKELFGTIFNAATIAFYWKTFEPEPGKPRYLASGRDSAAYWNALKEPWNEFHWRRPAPEKIIGFCEAKGIAMHGHPIIWGNPAWNHPAWVSKAPDKVGEMESLFGKRITEICRYYKDRIPSWDIVNESVDPTPGEPRYGVIPDDYTFKSFKLAEKDFPASVRFNINDSWRAVYPPFVRELIARGAKIDVVGLQMHIFNPPECLDIAAGKDAFPNGTSWKPLDVIRDLEELDTLKRPIHLSEVTIPSPGESGKALAIQAGLARDMYRLWFSWPSITRITWWNVVDDCGAKGEPLKSGLFTRRMEPKPAFHVLDHLIHQEWMTRMAVKAGQDGTVRFRGFKGRYRVSYTAADGAEKSMEFRLTKDGDGW
ncbi:MAG: endo-1,4-beta-xylanase [Luteolibacter sp.]|jgi:GH35 family endo-1,4-beta-xylanase|nr:endo-1,4-beta-xylanase [Luteolibacter sp.]